MIQLFIMRYLITNNLNQSIMKNAINCTFMAKKRLFYSFAIVLSALMGSAAGDGIFEEGEEGVLTATAHENYEFVERSNGSYKFIQNVQLLIFHDGKVYNIFGTRTTSGC